MAALIAKSKEKAAEQVRGKRGKSGHEKELLAGGEVAADKKSRPLVLHYGGSHRPGGHDVEPSKNQGPTNIFPAVHLLCFCIASHRHGNPGVPDKVQKEQTKMDQLPEPSLVLVKPVLKSSNGNPP